jgi:hypothetical protein
MLSAVNVNVKLKQGAENPAAYGLGAFIQAFWGAKADNTGESRNHSGPDAAL